MLQVLKFPEGSLRCDYTGGLWVAQRRPLLGYVIGADDQQGGSPLGSATIATLLGADDPRTEANARLIAAAPTTMALMLVIRRQLDGGQLVAEPSSPLPGLVREVTEAGCTVLR